MQTRPSAGAKGNDVKGNDDRPPLTPPRISGVSLAPLPDAELLQELPAVSCSHNPSLSNSGKERKRPPPVKAGAGGQVAPGHAPRLIDGNPPTKSDCTKQGMDAYHLVAEGRGIRGLAPLIVPSGGFTGHLAHLQIYNEINETDSLW